MARAAFKPGAIDPAIAKSFADRWRRKLFDGWQPQEREHIYVPLQGRVREQRSFQAYSPVEMVTHALSHAQGREVIATLHPNELYSDADLDALKATGVRLEHGQMQRFLPGAAVVVTHASSAPFNGYFSGKPTILYGRIDFHHIALDVHTLGVAVAFEQSQSHTPDFDRYLFWFWQRRLINAGHPTAEERIRAAMARAGWTLT
ncbi:MAG: hypothetical protein AAFP13_07865 [Pseudomonadota bacterium]